MPYYLTMQASQQQEELYAISKGVARIIHEYIFPSTGVTMV